MNSVIFTFDEVMSLMRNKATSFVFKNAQGKKLKADIDYGDFTYVITPI